MRGAVDDIVVVDTGSTDATKRIAIEAGARVVDFVWCDDFAAARNAGLRRARGQWVLVLDADERLAPGSVRRLRTAVANAKFDCGLLRLHDARSIDARPEDVVSGKERHAEVQLVPRLLRRVDGLAFVDAIHENVTPWLRRRGSKVAGVDVDLIHLGATPQVVAAKGKQVRNVRLLRARIEQNAADVDALGYLAHEYLRACGLDDAQAVIDQGWPHVRAAARDGVSIHRLATARAHLLVMRGRYADALSGVRLAQELEGDNPDLAFYAAYALESEAQETADPARRADLLTSARAAYLACQRFRDTVFSQSFVIGASTWYGSVRLGTVELLLGDAAGARRAFEAALALRPADRASLLGLAEARIATGELQVALSALERLLDEAPDGWTLAAVAAKKFGRSEDMRLFATRALALQGKGFIAPHRRETLRSLWEDRPSA